MGAIRGFRRMAWALTGLVVAVATLAPVPSVLAATATVLDTFTTVSYSNDDGTETWSTSWAETGDSGGAGGGDVAVVADGGDNRLRLRAKNNTISRSKDLTGSTTATLTYSYRRSGLDDAGDYVVIEVSPDGSSWTELTRYEGPATDATFQFASFDVSAYIGSATTVRLSTSSGLGKQDLVFFDDIQIEFDITPPGATLGASPAAATFGDVVVGRSADVPITLSHDGAVGTPPISITALDLVGPDAGEFSHDGAPITLPQGGSTVVTVTFSPTSQGAKSATLSITHDGTNSPVDVPLSGVGVLPDLDASPTSLDFGSIDVGTQSALPLTLTHSGQAGDPDITITDLSITGADAGSFTHDGVPPVTLAAGDSAVVNVTYSPTASGAHAASLGITHTGENTPLAVPLAGTGVQQGLKTIRDEFTTVAYSNNDGTDPWAADWVEFADDSDPASGDVKITDDLGDGSLLLQNTGPRIDRLATLEGATTATLRLDYRRQGLDAGESLEVSVLQGGNWVLVDTIDGPGTDAAYVARAVDMTPYLDRDSGVRFELTGGAGKSDKIFLDNVEIEYDFVPLPPLLVTPSTLVFDDTPGGLSSWRFVQLTHGGDPSDPAITFDLSTSGTNAGDFLPDVTAPQTLAPGDSTSMAIAFSPQATGPRTADLIVDHDGSGGTETVALSGTGLLNPLTDDAIRTDAVALVTRGHDGSPSNDDSGGWIDISGDGRYIAFYSIATNLVPGDTNGFGDVFVHDALTGITERVSVAATGEEANDFSGNAGISISDDGRYVAFSTLATNLTPDRDRNRERDVVVVDRTTGSVTMVSVSTSGSLGNDASTYPQLSGDGSVVVFQSDATNLVSGDNNALSDVFLHDLATGTTERLSVSATGDQADGDSSSPQPSYDGSKVAFLSHATNLLATPTNDALAAFVLDRATGQLTRVSTEIMVFASGELQEAWMREMRLSGNGNVLAYDCGCVFYQGLPVLWYQGYVYDLGTSTRTELPRDFGGFRMGIGGVSDDGRFVAARSRHPLIDKNENVYVLDRFTGAVRLVSPDLATGGELPNSDPGNTAPPPPISADGSTIGYSMRFFSFKGPGQLVPGESRPNIYEFYIAANSALLYHGSSSAGWDKAGAWRSGVNAGLRSYVLAEPDLDVAVVGPPLAMSRTYNSKDTRDNGLGPGWTHPYAMTLEPGPAGSRVVLHPDGRREIHAAGPGGTFTPPIGYFSTLEADGSGGHTLTLVDDTVYAFDADGLLTTVTDANGRQQTITRDANDKVDVVTDGTSGRTLTFTWTGDLISGVATNAVTGTGPLAWAYYYDAEGRLVQACDPRDTTQTTGVCTTYGYNADGLLDEVTRPEGNVESSLAYTSEKLVESITDGEGHTTQYQVGQNAFWMDIVDGRGNTVTEIYDSEYRLVQSVSPTKAVTTYRYDADGNRDRVVDANGNVALLTYDADGNLLTVTNGESEVSYFEYDADDNVIATRDGRSSGPTDDTYKTTFEYDSARNTTAEVDPLGNRQEWDYTDGTEPAVGGGLTPPGLLERHVEARGTEPGALPEDYATAYQYYANGDLAEVVTPSGLTTSYTYDEVGRLLSETLSDPPSVTTYTYDPAGNVLVTTGPAIQNVVSGATHQLRNTTTYDRNSNPTQVVVEDLTGGGASRTTLMGYDLNDRETSVTDPALETMFREYDEVGNVKAVVDREGRRTETTYDASNLPVRVVLKDFDDGFGSPPRDIVLSTIDYDAAGRKIRETDAEGRVTEWMYDGADRVLTVERLGYEDLAGAVRDVVLSATTYDDAGNVLSQRSGDGSANQRTIVNAYDAASRVTTSTITVQGVARVTTYGYDAAGNVTSTVISDGSRSEAMAFEFDEAGNQVKTIVDPGGLDLATTTGYDARGNPTSVVDARGNAPGATPGDFTTVNEYDAANRLIRVTSPPVPIEVFGSAPIVGSVVAETGYDAFGNATHQRDGRGFVTVTTYDALDRIERIDHPPYTTPDLGSGSTTLSPAEIFAYDKVGNLTSETSRRGFTTDYEYDDLNRVASMLDPPASAGDPRGLSTYEYDDAGNRTAAVDERGARIEWTYDALDRVRTEVHVVRLPGGGEDRHTWSYDHDDLGNRTVTREPSGAETLLAYSEASEVLSVTDALTNVSSFAYDLQSRQTRATDRAGRITEGDYDLAGRLVEERRVAPGGTPTLTTTMFDYDEVGNQDLIVSPRGFSTVLAYDALSRLTTVTGEVEAGVTITTTFGHDQTGATTRVTDGRGNDFRYGHNPWGLEEQVVEPATAQHPAAGDRTWTTAYDAGGLAVAELQPGGVLITRTYDALGRLTSESGSGGGTAAAARSFDYDLAGHLTSASHPAGTLTYDFDDRGLMTLAAGPAGATTFAYDGTGRLIQRDDPAGPHTFTWTARNELETATDPLTATTLTYSWTPASQLDASTYGATGIVRNHTFDDLGRLDTDTLSLGAAVLQSFDYDYDLDGNVAQRLVTAPGNPEAGLHVYDHDGLNRLTSWDGPAGPPVAYSWDDSGNRQAAGADTYAYDERNRLVTGPAGSYTYSARGTLTVDGGGATTVFDALGRLTDYDGLVAYSYDAFDRIATRNGTPFAYAGTAIDPSADGTFSYARSPAGRLLGQSDGASALLAGLDRHGDLTALFDGAGTVTDSRVYDPFGVVAGETGTTAPLLGFQADYTDPASDAVWMGARWYSAADAAFRSRDTVFGELRTPISLNRYTYAWANPLVFWDPAGRYIDEPGDVRNGQYVGNGYTKAENEARAARARQRFPWEFPPEPAPTKTTVAAATRTAVDLEPEWPFEKWFQSQVAGADAEFPVPSSFDVALTLETRDAAFPDSKLFFVKNQHGFSIQVILYDSLSMTFDDISDRYRKQSGTEAEQQFEEYMRLCQYTASDCVAASHILYFGDDLEAAAGARQEVCDRESELYGGPGQLCEGPNAIPDPVGNLVIDVVAGFAAAGLVSAGRAGLARLGSRGATAAAASPLDELAAFRAQQGLPVAGSADDAATAARLDVGGRTFYGQNAHGRDITIRVNAQTATHAEADVFQQALEAGVSSKTATLYVDRALCVACGAKGGVGSLMRGLGVDDLLVVSPEGNFLITSVRPSVPIPLTGG